MTVLRDDANISVIFAKIEDGLLVVFQNKVGKI